MSSFEFWFRHENDVTAHRSDKMLAHFFMRSRCLFETNFAWHCYDHHVLYMPLCSTSIHCPVELFIDWLHRWLAWVCVCLIYIYKCVRCRFFSTVALELRINTLETHNDSIYFSTLHFIVCYVLAQLTPCRFLFERVCARCIVDYERAKCLQDGLTWLGRTSVITMIESVDRVLDVFETRSRASNTLIKVAILWSMDFHRHTFEWCDTQP